MKIAIVGEKERAAAWEKHVRKLPVVKEVVITSSLSVQSDCQAVLLIDDSPENLQRLLHSIKAGNHTYLISRLPHDSGQLKNVQQASEEAGVNVQFSHWPSMSESMSRLREEVQKPDFIQIKKESVPQNYRIIDIEDFDRDWTDEIALIAKWMGGNIYHYEVKPVVLGTMPAGLNITLRYENSALVSFQYLASSDKEKHQRLFANRNVLADFDVLSQKLRLHKVNDLKRIAVQEKVFDPSDTAEWSVVQFIRSIELKQPALFTTYDALVTSRIAEKIRSLMEIN